MKQNLLAILIVFMLPGFSPLAAQFCSNHNYNIQVTDTLISPACAQNGQINVGVTGGAAPYTFQWYLAYTTQVIANTQNLTSAYAGDYMLLVTDNNGTCTNYYAVIPPAFELITFTEPDTSCPIHSGTANVIPINGRPPYSYLWSNGGTTGTITHLTGGTYDVTVTDSAGCQVVASHNDSVNLSLYSYGQLNISLTGYNPSTCADTNGSVSAVVTGGNPPYIYKWSAAFDGVPNPAWTTAQINNLAGNEAYYITVTDSIGCLGMSQYDNLVFTNPIVITCATTPQNCLNLNGTASAVANGITGPYSYVWSNGSTAQSITGLSQGYFTVTVTDINGCSNKATTYVSYYSPIYINLTYVNQQCTVLGSASTAPTLGTTPYSFLWSTGATTSSINSLHAGNSYHVTVTDNAGCSAAGGIEIYDVSPILPNETHTDQLCSVQSGAITLAPSGGAAPYTYLWSSGQTTSAIIGLQTGLYYFTITDSIGCQNSESVYINYNPGFSAMLFSTASPTCTSANGELGAQIISGTGPFTYLWNNGSTNSINNGLASGYYSVTITSNNGCSVEKDTSLGSVSPLYAYVSAIPATCIFTNDGVATVSIYDGTPPFTYAWGNGSVASYADSLDARWGIGVRVTDANGCTADAYVNDIGYTSLNCAAIISGTVVNDANSDCQRDSNDGFLQNAYITCAPGGYGTLTDVYGNYQMIVPPASYAITQFAQYREQACPDGSIVLNNCSADSTYTGNNFYDRPLDVKDLRVSLSNYELPQPGRTQTIEVYYENNGLYSVGNAQVTFNYDTGVIYISGGDSVDPVHHMVTINCGTLAPVSGGGFADVTFATPTTTPLGTIETFTATITPLVGDATPPNNSETQQFTVVSSYDPNYLLVSPQGSGTPGYISTNDSVLKYTIHFQNTGTFQTSVIAIRDTLDPNLDLSTIQIGASSFPVTMKLLNNTLIFLLDPIYLPDSATDPIASNGIVSFYIKQRKGLAAGTQIHNRAGIYFDYNLPVPTNTTLNTLDNNGNTEENTTDAFNIQLNENPTTGSSALILNVSENFSGYMLLTNMLGQKLSSQNLNLTPGVYNLPLVLNNFASGTYLVYVRDAKHSKCLHIVRD